VQPRKNRRSPRFSLLLAALALVLGVGLLVLFHPAWLLRAIGSEPAPTTPIEPSSVLQSVTESEVSEPTTLELAVERAEVFLDSARGQEIPFKVARGVFEESWKRVSTTTDSLGVIAALAPSLDAALRSIGEKMGPMEESAESRSGPMLDETGRPHGQILIWKFSSRISLQLEWEPTSVHAPRLSAGVHVDSRRIGTRGWIAWTDADETHRVLYFRVDDAAHTLNESEREVRVLATSTSRAWTSIGARLMELGSPALRRLDPSTADSKGVSTEEGR